MTLWPSGPCCAARLLAFPKKKFSISFGLFRVRKASRIDCPVLTSDVDLSAIAHPLARDVIERLQTLRRHINSTTPYDLLSQAVDVLRVRPILLERHRGHAERALANVDLYLSLSRAYAVRGLRAFAEAMTAAWTDKSRAVEGRPDAQEEAVVLFTMHAAKGLEWPIVIPVNTMTSVSPTDGAIIDRQTDTFYCKVLDVAPAGYENARKGETEELECERVRLWYVAATRARELLVLPRFDAAPSKSAWISLVDLAWRIFLPWMFRIFPPTSLREMLDAKIIRRARYLQPKPARSSIGIRA